jgi:ankyrin repeat protein
MRDNITSLPLEVTLMIASYLLDPADYHAFQPANSTLYQLLHERFISPSAYLKSSDRIWDGLSIAPEHHVRFFSASSRDRELHGKLLWTSCTLGHLHLTAALLRRSAPVNNSVDLTEISSLPQYLNPLVTAAKHGHLEIVWHLLAKGARIEAQTYWNEYEEGGTAPQAAAEGEVPVLECRGHPVVVQELLENGADPNGEGERSDSALLKAKDTETILLLLKAGANPNVRTARKGSSPLHLCIWRVWKGGRWIAQANIKRMRMLLGFGADVDAQDHRQRTVLHIATKWGCKDVVKFLCRSGANPCLPDYCQFMPLEYASELRAPELAKYLQSYTLDCLFGKT